MIIVLLEAINENRTNGGKKHRARGALAAVNTVAEKPVIEPQVRSRMQYFADNYVGFTTSVA